jgi:enterochelin esterase family protein
MAMKSRFHSEISRPRENQVAQSLLRVFLVLAFAATSQPQTPPAADTLVSPEIHADRTVSFRIRAPKASEVGLFGDWMPIGKLEPLTKGSDGVWSVTTGPIDATGHLYTFNVDGVTMTDPINPKVKLRQRTSASLIEVPADPPAAWSARDVPHGSVVTEWQKSAVLGRTERMLIYLPPGYQKSSARFPVLYLVHGNGDVPESWTNAGNANLILDNLIADKSARPMIVVMPAGHAAPYGPAGRGQNNTELFDQYLVKDLIPFVESQYRVSAGKQNRALAGLSMGGGLTINVGFSHLDLFSALGIFSPAIPRDFETKYKAALDDPKGTNAKLSLVWIACGDQDNTVQYPRVKQFAELLDKHQVHETFRTIEGGAHVWPVWRVCLTEFAPLLFKNTNR